MYCLQADYKVSVMSHYCHSIWEIEINKEAKNCFRELIRA